MDVEVLRAIFPYGQVRVQVARGGLDITRAVGKPTVIANACISVSFDMEAQA